MKRQPSRILKLTLIGLFLIAMASAIRAADAPMILLLPLGLGLFTVGLLFYILANWRR